MSRMDNKEQRRQVPKLINCIPTTGQCHCIENSYFSVRFKNIALLCVLLPLASLAICFSSAVLFQKHIVNKTKCQVYNFIPSISAVTGIFPQCYLWRITIALHCTPRFIMGSMYSNLYYEHTKAVTSTSISIYNFLINLTYWLHFTENLSLIGVTYISNKDNYPVHEKLFVIFMFSSMTHMLTSLILVQLAKLPSSMTDRKKAVHKMKWILFITVCVSTIGLLYFFYRHRFHCDELAFSWFSLCEYVICVGNISFHGLIAWDFEDELFFVSKIVPAVHNPSHQISSSRKTK